MTLKDKRDLIRRFKAGESVASLCKRFRGSGIENCPEVQAVIRDFLNRKFTLTEKEKKS